MSNNPYFGSPTSSSSGGTGADPHQGPWNAVTVYSLGDTVGHDGVIFISDTDGNVANEPELNANGQSSTIGWSVYGAKGLKGDKGDQGDAGADGADGQNGADGADGADGETPTLTDNGDGTYTIATSAESVVVSDGAKGDQGDQGETGLAGADGADGADGETPTLTNNGDGTYTIATSTQSIVLSDGADGANGADGADGANGADGADGADGETPTLTDNGDGTYTIATSTESIVLSDGAKGDQGDAGADGANGLNGEDGETPTLTDNGDGTFTIATSSQSITFADGVDGEDGVGTAGFVPHEATADPDQTVFVMPSEYDDVRVTVDGAGQAPSSYTKNSPNVEFAEAFEGGELVVFDLFTDLQNYAGTVAGPQGAQGEKGDTGDAGADGETPTLTDNGDGTYTIATSTESVVLSDGAKGDTGDAGADGTDGADGETPTITNNGDGTYTIATSAESVTLSDGADGADGANGADGETPTLTDNGDGTYTIATSTQSVVLSDGAKGDTGDTGATGPEGPAGPDGSNLTVEEYNTGARSAGSAQRNWLFYSTGAADSTITVDAGMPVGYVVSVAKGAAGNPTMVLPAGDSNIGSGMTATAIGEVITATKVGATTWLMTGDGA